MPTPAQWAWSGASVTDNSNGTSTVPHLNSDASNPTVPQDSSNAEATKPATEEVNSNDKNDNDSEQLKATAAGGLKKPFPTPRQSAPITRPPDTAQEQEEAELSIEEQVKLAKQRDKEAEAGAATTTTTTIHGHTNGESAGKLTDIPKDKETKTGEAEPEKQPAHEASVGEKRGRSEEPVEVSGGQADNTTPGDTKERESKKDTPAAAETIPEPEPKKPRVEEPTTGVVDSTAVSSSKPAKTNVNTVEKVAEPPKKKAGRPKKEEVKAVTGERKNSVSSRTRSKANAEDVSI
ncbi:hypothetical protein TWF718_011045 [Orbilia javanica]|uniref:Uncharacterized protein n=1 Tax=Orbilia javanica TaxID=47235 RepID=A0AAN8RD44_9PEZI